MSLFPLSSVRLHVLVAAIFLFCSSALHAQTFFPPNSNGVPPDYLSDVVRASAGDQGSGAFFEFLWLRPSSSKLLFAIQSPVRTGLVEGQLEGLHPKREAGFRFRALSRIGSRTPALEFEYTHFTSQRGESRQRGNGEIWNILGDPDSIVADNATTDLVAYTPFSLRQCGIGSAVSFRFGSEGVLSLSSGIQYHQPEPGARRDL